MSVVLLEQLVRVELEVTARMVQIAQAELTLRAEAMLQVVLEVRAGAAEGVIPVELVE
ncbi:MAG: hypothetical protein IPK83_05210 [Planctomycetes bacterium]|nr:hypothetical protein [Planctomycetota bacterium]